MSNTLLKVGIVGAGLAYLFRSQIESYLGIGTSTATTTSTAAPAAPATQTPAPAPAPAAKNTGFTSPTIPAYLSPHYMGPTPTHTGDQSGFSTRTSFTTAATRPPVVSNTPTAPNTGFGRQATGAAATRPSPFVSTSPLATLPITQDVLVKASYDPETATLLGNNPAGMLDTDQWNYYRAQSGRPQITVDIFTGDRSQLITATQYQSLVNAAQQQGRITSLQGFGGYR